MQLRIMISFCYLKVNVWVPLFEILSISSTSYISTFLNYHPLDTFSYNNVLSIQTPSFHSCHTITLESGEGNSWLYTSKPLEAYLLYNTWPVRFEHSLTCGAYRSHKIKTTG